MPRFLSAKKLLQIMPTKMRFTGNHVCRVTRTLCFPDSCLRPLDSNRSCRAQSSRTRLHTCMIFQFQGSMDTNLNISNVFTRITHTKHWKNNRLLVESKSKELRVALFNSTMLAEAAQYAAPETMCMGNPGIRRGSSATNGFSSLSEDFSNGPFSMSFSSDTAMFRCYGRY